MEGRKKWKKRTAEEEEQEEVNIKLKSFQIRHSTSPPAREQT